MIMDNLQSNQNFIDNTTRSWKMARNFGKMEVKNLKQILKMVEFYFENYWNEKGEQTLIKEQDFI